MKTIGIALGVERLVAALPGGRRLETAETADIGQAIADLKAQSGMAEARVSVALVPPLIAVRRVKLPPMRGEERHRVLERDAARHFVGVREPQAVATDGSLAVALPTHLLEELEAAIDAAGWRLDAVVPAHVAWAACLADGKHAIPVAPVAEVVEVRRRRMTDRMLLRHGDSTV